MLRLDREHDVAVAWLLACLTALAPLSVDGVVPGFPATGRAFHVDLAHVQWLLSAFLVGSAVGQLVWGPVADRIGRRPSLLGGLLLFAAGTALCLWAPGFGVLLAGRVVQSLAGAVGLVVTRAIVEDWYEGERAVRIMGLLAGATFLAPAVGPLVGGWATHLYGWQGMYAFLLVWSGAGLAMVGIGLPETRPGGAGGGTSLLGSLAPVLADRRFLVCTAITSLAWGGMFAFIAGSPAVLMERLGLSPAAFGHTYMIVPLGFMLGARLNARWNDLPLRARLRRGLAPGVVAGVLLAGLTSAGLRDGTLGVTVVVACAFLYYLSLGLAQPVSMSAALSGFQNLAGAASSWLGFAQLATGAVFSVVVGRLQSGTEMAMALAFLGCSLVGLALAAVLPDEP